MRFLLCVHQITGARFWYLLPTSLQQAEADVAVVAQTVKIGRWTGPDIMVPKLDCFFFHRIFYK